MRHHERPVHSTEYQAMVEAKMKVIMASAYYQYVFPLKEKVVGKIVAKSRAGASGFALFFSDGDWVATYLHDMKLNWEMGKGEFREDLEAWMNSAEYGDGFHPLSIDRPYASEVCNISAEITKAHGKGITGISFGTRSFNFCFPKGMELDTTIVPTSNKKYALRVFWERW